MESAEVGDAVGALEDGLAVVEDFQGKAGGAGGIVLREDGIELGGSLGMSRKGPQENE